MPPLEEKYSEESSFSKVRPDRDDQVLGYPGDEVELKRFYNNQEGYSVITVRNIDNHWMEVIVIKYHDKPERIEKISMADLGMVPYPDTGLWNQTNWAELA